MAQHPAQPFRNHQSVVPPRRIAVIYRAVTELKPDPANPRRHSKKQVRQLARSIQVFGFNVPVLTDTNNNVIAGHGRILACQQLGLREVPTISLEHLTPAQAKAYLIADNRLTEIATWDERLLGEQLNALSEVELDFGLEVTGFETGEIDLFIEGLNLVEESKPDPADEVPEPAPVQVSRVGDQWQLEAHRVLCGNALEENAYATVMGGKQAAIVITDPPYNVPIPGHAGGLGRIQHSNFAMACGEMSKAQFTEFLQKFCALACRYSMDGALHYVFMDWRHMGELLTAGLAACTELKNVCVWIKDNGGMGSLYRSQHEFVFVFKHGQAPHHNNVELGRFGRNRTNVWQYRGVNSFGRETDEGNPLVWHPTPKPVQLVADAILDASARGDIVLDPFLGSGTTVIAAERVGRTCYGLELDPKYVDTIIRRWQAFTGLKARHAVNGKLFDELAAEMAEDSHDR